MNNPEPAEFLCGLNGTDVSPGSLSTILDILNSLSILSTELDNILIKQARARKVAFQVLPLFSLGPNHTKSNALYDIEFRWSNKVIKYTHGLGDPEAESHLTGDETGLWGVFNHSVAFMVGKVPKAQSIDLKFADSKCLGSPYANTPDNILMTKNTQLKVIRELKVS
ncbi:hypothetical protein BDV32DRAFT_150398 [Aspergillus pseudonomiae]|uniref:Uncharacterized protein n=1 Tax=Aspergillus pseudonomiae TaxID=1506151 RepID=A0A5N7DDJ8_9EURO|nr:uncharacterized protein BDV37DRAFT_282871 [Aspergillus pseudonomiae]KAB8259514.1 hypothetical protein BDV32DRAFT_150398 [Aspergillus pseudonomiae]KAE8404324.1 hypothetical protein BDV37DRAFT_282871 [Aspergillus pseudonomiae]